MAPLTFFHPLATILRISCFNMPAVSPQVGIIMGSDSDLPVMKEAAKILREFDVPTEVGFKDLSVNFCVFG